jgi:hypothetical protein
METRSDAIIGDVEPSTPRAVRYAVFAGLFVLLGSAAYLIGVRGEAILVDLASMGSRAWCF